MLDSLLQADHRLFLLINGHHAVFLDFFFRAVTWLGNGWVAIPSVLLIAGFRAPRDRRKNVLGAVALCFLASGLLAPAIKKAVGRARPLAYFADHDASGAPGTEPVRVLGPSLKKKSFPSGHANTAFTAAAVLSFLFGGWFWFSFGPAFLVAYSRCYLGDHFPLDTAAGALLGIGVVWVVLWFRQREDGAAEKRPPAATGE